MEPSETLKLLADISRDDFNPNVRRWLQNAVNRFEAGESLLCALELNKVHSRGARYALRRHKMLTHLHRAAAMIPGADPWAKAVALYSEIRAFSRRWPSIKDSPIPPAGLSDLRKELFHAFRAGCKVPESENRLYEILTDPHKYG